MVMEELRSEYLINRAAAVRTICHEFFHAVRISDSRQTPRALEEGLADLFADIMCEKLLGDSLAEYSSYPEFRKGAEGLCGLMGGGDFYAGWTVFVESRSSPNMYGWARDQLENCGVDAHDTARLLGYTDTSVWLTIIDRLTQDLEKG